jgi:hypothetical protein
VSPGCASFFGTNAVSSIRSIPSETISRITSERLLLLASAIISMVESSEGSTFIVTGTNASLPMRLRPGLAWTLASVALFFSL